MPRRLLGLVAIALVACGGSSDPKALVDEGYAALGSGNMQKASEKLGDALELLQEGDPQWKRAKLGKLQSMCSFQPELAAKEFLELAEGHGLGESEFALVIDELRDNKHFVPALEVGKAGLAKFGEQGDGGAMDHRLQELTDDIANADLPEAENELEKLGYLSGD